MEALILSALRAARSLFAPGMLRLFAFSLVLTIAALIAFVALSSGAFAWAAGHFHHEFLGWVGSLGSFFIAWLLFPGIMPVIVSFFDERIAALIEGRDYPACAPPAKSEFWPELLHDMRFSALVIALNLLVLPLYLFPPLMPLLFYGLNGYLLGREFFVMAARRHMSAGAAEALRKEYRGPVMAGGVLLTIMATLPIANLFAPFWGVALMVHLYHWIAKTPDSALLPP